MAPVSITIKQKAGEQDQLFGSVTSKDIAEALEKAGYSVERRKIQLEAPIKQVGEFKVPIRLHRDVTVDITVTVARDEEEAAATTEAEAPKED
jgi:large subunit ribosomal protein L9